MKIEMADLITIEEEKYITLNVTNYNGADYGIVNKLSKEDEEPTEELYIVTVINNKIEKITDENLINTLLPIFEKNLQDEIKKISESEIN